MNSRKNILITGADGFIGSHLTEYLCNKGFNVKAFCLYNSIGNWGWLDYVPQEIKDNVEIILGDIRDPGCVKKAMKGCDYIYHLAALIAIPYSYKAPLSYIQTNIIGTLNILESARELGCEKIIHTSTSETYGTAQYVPINEIHPLNAQSPYAATKIGADQLALSYWKSFKVPLSIIRPFNTYGPRQSARAVIPTIISQIAEGKTTIKLGALTPTRDFNYVEDTCSAFFEISKSNNTIGEVINSASNYEISIGDTANLISDIMNVKINIIQESQRKRPDNSEVQRLFGDNSKLRKLTKWEPKYAGLDGFSEGLRKTVDWFTNPINLSFYKSNMYVI